MNFTNFCIETLAEGVYAAIASPTGAAGSNSGIINLGDETIVFDTTATISAARELLSAARELTGRTPTYVINSHSHPDHVHGNVVFSETAVLVSSATTRNEICRDGIQLMTNMHNDLTTQMNSFREQIAAGVEEGTRTELEAAIAFFDGIIQGYPTPEDLRTPTLTYDNKLEFHGSKRSAKLLTYGGAHSACDAVLWLPEDKILFAGDVVGNPVLCLGQPGNWWNVLEKLESLCADRVIPGHGQVWSKNEGFEATRRHLHLMFEFARQAMESGNPADYAENVTIPDGQSEYWFRKDLRFLVDHLLTTK